MSTVSAYVPYHEPNLVAVLTLASFVYFANVARWIADELLFAGLLGEILVGIIFGAPLAGILSASWEQTFLDLGYIGLLLVVFEGGLTTPLQKLVKALPLASAIALSGIGIPIALSFLLIPIGSYSRLEAFAAGSSLSSTSLGTTFVVLKAVSGGDVPVGRLEETLLGTVLAGAAVFDDIIGFVLSSVIRTVGETIGSGDVTAWPLVRPLVTSLLFAGAAPLVCKFIVGPLHRKLLVPWLSRSPLGKDGSLLVLILILSASLAISYYIDSSMLLGAYVAGLIVSALDEHVKRDLLQAKLPSSPSSNKPTPTSPSGIPSPREQNTPTPPISSSPQSPSASPSNPTTTHYPLCRAVYEEKIGPIQKYMLSPLFFASIGTAIPFISLFTGKRIWQGVVYTLLMTFAKAVCGVWILLFAWGSRKNEKRLAKKEVVLKEEKGLEMTAAPGMEGEEEDQSRSGDAGEGSDPVQNRGVTPTQSTATEQKEKLEEEATSLWAALFLGLALVARGEIGLLISQIGFTEAGLLGDDAFLVTTWAIVLCTIIGPVSVGLLIKRKGIEKVVPPRWR